MNPDTIAAILFSIFMVLAALSALGVYALCHDPDDWADDDLFNDPTTWGDQ